MPDPIRRIGVLTGGGDCPGLNAVLRAVAKTAILEYGLEVLGIEDGFEGLVSPARVRPLTLESVRGILPRGGTILGTTNRSNPFQFLSTPQAAEVKPGQQITDVSEQVIQNTRSLGIDVLIVIGGDGSLTIAQALFERGLPVVGVPKTIDNDLNQTQLTFGFDTALNTAMDALDKLHTTAESHHRIIVLEVMGRNAGWIALEAGIAGGADVILIPEIPYRLDSIAAKIMERNRRGARFSLVVVAEGAWPVGGQPIYRQDKLSTSGQRLGGIGEVVAAQLSECCQMEVRVTVLGHLQRGGTPTAFDRLLASRFGNAAVHLAAQQKIGWMVALQNDEIVSVPIRDAVSSLKQVPLNSDLIKTAFGLGINLGSTPDSIL
jgi:ATP-dependent phosphofructokinase / diphosphate-dependent phosphofructokinase